MIFGVLKFERKTMATAKHLIVVVVDFFNNKILQHRYPSVGRWIGAHGHWWMT